MKSNLGRKEFILCYTYSLTSWGVRARAQVAAPSAAAMIEFTGLLHLRRGAHPPRRPLLHPLLFKAMQQELSHRLGPSGGVFSTAVHSSKITLAWVKLIKTSQRTSCLPWQWVQSRAGILMREGRLMWVALVLQMTAWESRMVLTASSLVERIAHRSQSCTHTKCSCDIVMRTQDPVLN